MREQRSQMLVKIALSPTASASNSSDRCLLDLLYDKINLLYHAMQQQVLFRFDGLSFAYEDKTCVIFVLIKPDRGNPHQCIGYCVWMVDCFIYLWLQDQFQTHYEPDLVKPPSNQAKRSEIIYMSSSDLIWDYQKSKQALLPENIYL